MTTWGINYILSVACGWVAGSTFLPEESGCKSCELTQKQIFMRCECMCVSGLGGGGGL